MCFNRCYCHKVPLLSICCICCCAVDRNRVSYWKKSIPILYCVLFSHFPIAKHSLSRIFPQGIFLLYHRPSMVTGRISSLLALSLAVCSVWEYSGSPGVAVRAFSFAPATLLAHRHQHATVTHIHHRQVRHVKWFICNSVWVTY